MKSKKQKSDNESRDETARKEDLTAESLIKSPSFQWRVAVKVALICGVLFVIQGLFTNWWLARRFANYVATTNSDVSNRIFVAKQEVNNRIAAEFATVRIRTTVEDVASNRASFLLDKQIEPEISKFKEEMTNKLHWASQSIRVLTNASLFAMTLFAAQSNDKRAFEQLRAWAGDPSFVYNAEASRAYTQILDWHNEESAAIGLFGHASYMAPWGTAPDPKWTLEQIRNNYWSLDIIEAKLGLIQATSARTDLTTSEKMTFFVDLLTKESDLKPLSLAGRYFRESANYNLKTLCYPQFLQWWQQNSNRFATPLTSTQK